MFRLRNDAREWFRYIHPKTGQKKSDILRLRFDPYYLCLMAGLVTGRKAKIKSGEARDVLDYFPEEYAKSGRLLIALFLDREIKKLGIAPTNRKLIHETVVGFLDPMSGSGLSAEGFKQFNRYAHGGFEVLSEEWFDAPPRLVEAFLASYCTKLSSTRSPIRQRNTANK